MTKLPRRWQDLAWTDFATLPADTVAILPVAAIEQHGPHLPVSVDATINEGVLTRALDRLPAALPVLVLPMQSIGLSIEHIQFPGTLTLPMETLTSVWTEIGLSVARAGLRKLVILNSHGGQPQVVDIVCRRLRGQARMLAVACMWSRLGYPPELDLGDVERRHGIHGGLVETSLMLALRPDLVRMEKAQNFHSAWEAQETRFTTLVPEGAVGFGWEAQDLNQAGALGDASRATAAIGDRLLSHASEKFAKLLEEVHSLDLSSWLRDKPDAG
jgi:creatinine amidohydrolase